MPWVLGYYQTREFDDFQQLYIRDTSQTKQIDIDLDEIADIGDIQYETTSARAEFAENLKKQFLGSSVTVYLLLGRKDLLLFVT